MARSAVQARLQAAIEADARTEAEALAERARIAQTSLRYRDAATLLAEAADLTAFAPETSWHHPVGPG
ncbi:MAG: hypothetical protein R3D25_17890 [Geminicoccaceae bacterium]